MNVSNVFVFRLANRAGAGGGGGGLRFVLFDKQKIVPVLLTTSSPRRPVSLCSCATATAAAAQNRSIPNDKRKFWLFRTSQISSSAWTSSARISTSSIASLLAPHNNIGPTSTSTAAECPRSKSGQWDLFAGIVVERKPVITQDKDALEEKYFKYISQIEFEQSKKSDHEVKHDNDMRMLEKVKAGETDLGNVQTARDNKDRWTAEAQLFKPAERKTEADQNNDVKSLERALDSHLLLLVQQKLGNKYHWICPHSKLEQGETLRHAAERMLRDIFPDLKTKVLGHAPWGFYKYKYPPQPSTDTSVHTPSGAKVFFYKAQVISGESNVTFSEKNEYVKDFVWLKRDELQTKLQPEYFKKLSECLIGK